MKATNILAWRGIHFVATRFGPKWLRSKAFDAKYARGDWKFKANKNTEFQAQILKYLNKGDLLIMGCGGASILEGIQPEELSSALGIDLSQEAIRLAAKYSSEKIHFLQADMLTFIPQKKYDVILFSESLNYIPSEPANGLLIRLSDYLKPNGVFIVTFSESKRYKNYIDMIASTFQLTEDRNFSNSSRHVQVFAKARNPSP